MNLNKSKYGIIPIFFLIGLGLLVMILSYSLGLGGLHNPGPGLMPFLLGFFLFLASIYFLITFFYKKASGDGVVKEEQGQINYVRLCMVLASLFAYSLLFETLGFLITTLLILIILFRSTNNRWYAVLIASVLTAFISYVLFSYLGIRFPKGILKWM